MKQLRWLMFVCAGLLAISTANGCGKKSGPKADPDVEAKAKVDAMKKLADAMEREPEGVDARAALEELRLHPIDVQKNPQQADEILQIYRNRIEGKIRGEVAQELKGELGSIIAK
jgi:hypothetical protein